MLALIAVLVIPPSADIFVSGRVDASAPFDTYRIPAICRTEKGTVLAFAEGRNSISDQASNVLVMRRRPSNSMDWTDLQIVANDAPHALNNPCLLPTKSGRIWLVYQRYPAGLKESSVKPGLSRETSCLTFLKFSDDDGKSWSESREVSSILNGETIRSVAVGPGVGIELQRGPHKGRLLFPFNQRDANGWTTFGFYSDDKGKTWKRGPAASKAPETNPNEAQCVELADGSVLMNARNQAVGRFRLQGTSADGGRTWSTMQPVPELPDPVCMGSILRISFQPDLIALSNPNDTKARVNGGLRLSRDGGKSWSDPITIEPGSFAYSSLVPISGKRVGVLYETVQWKGGQEIYVIRYKEIELSPPYRRAPD